jgi:Bacterial PH domain
VSEQVTGTMRALITRGLKGDLHCVLVFTTDRIIVAVQSMLFQVASGMGGVGGAIGAVAGHGAMKGQDVKGKLDQLSPQEILGSNKKNYQVPYTDITKVQIGKKLGTSRLYIRTSNETYKFKFQFEKFEQIEGSIRSFLPSSLPVESGQLD